MKHLISIIGLTFISATLLNSTRPVSVDAQPLPIQEVQVKQLKQPHLTQSSKITSKAKFKPEPVQAAPVPVSGAKAFIYQHESGNNPGAINASSGACGLGQALPCSKMPCSLSDYACQDNFFTQYMLSRYGTWENAVAFWQSHKWW